MEELLNPLENESAGEVVEGSAAAVAAGIAIAALGTDTGGSIRQPVGLCWNEANLWKSFKIWNYSLFIFTWSMWTNNSKCWRCSHLIRYYFWYDPMDSTSANIDYDAVTPDLMLIKIDYCSYW